MAEEERLTKKERRTRSREERKRKEEEARRKARRQSLISGVSTVAVVAVIGLVVWTAFRGGPDVVSNVEITSAEAEQARTAAGCEIDDRTGQQFDATHFEPNTAPALPIMYPDVRPPLAGPHFTQFNNAVSAADNQLDERSTTHNMEHGAIIAWYDPDQLDAGTPDEIGAWGEALNASGFLIRRNAAYVGASIFTSPFTDPGISSGKAVALRAWGVGMDCDEWNETAANAFVIDNFGTHGASPERSFAPYPEEALGYADTETGDNTEAPTGHRTDTPTDMQPHSTETGTGSPTDTTSPAPTPSP